MTKCVFNHGNDTPCSHVIQWTCIEHHVALYKYMPFLCMLKTTKKMKGGKGRTQLTIY